MPMIQTPGHSSFPAGHAVENFMFATVLAELAYDREQQLYPGGSCLRDQLMWLAARISINRVVAGVHFPVDMAAGMVLGSQLGRHFVALTKESPGSFQPWTFNANYYGTEDFRWDAMLNALDGGLPVFSPEYPENTFLAGGASFTLPILPNESPLRWLWKRAAEEWPVLA
jgi:hypothetical protein